MTSPFQFLLAVGLLFHEAACVGLTAEKSLIRSEFQASGAIRLVDDSKPKDKDIDFCDFDFPVGTDCACSDPANHEPIQLQEMCIEAARLAGVTAPQATGAFEINEAYFHKRPKGCFKFPCAEDKRGICYFWNDVEDGPAKCNNIHLPDGSQPAVEGIKICQRPKLLNGTVDGNGGCPFGYSPVMHEDTCFIAGTCLGDAVGKPQFRKHVFNMSEYNDFPMGCFFDVGANKGDVYFNPKEAILPDPSKPKGIPICNVSAITDFRDQPEVPLAERTDSSALHSANLTATAAPDATAAPTATDAPTTAAP